MTAQSVIMRNGLAGRLSPKSKIAGLIPCQAIGESWHISRVNLIHGLAFPRNVAFVANGFADMSRMTITETRFSIMCITRMDWLMCLIPVAVVGFIVGFFKSETRDKE
jgi:hypothetical protein